MLRQRCRRAIRFLHDVQLRQSHEEQGNNDKKRGRKREYYLRFEVKCCFFIIGKKLLLLMCIFLKFIWKKVGEKEYDNTWEPEWNLSEDLLGEAKKMRGDNELFKAITQPLPVRHMNMALEIV